MPGDDHAAGAAPHCTRCADRLARGPVAAYSNETLTDEPVVVDGVHVRNTERGRRRQRGGREPGERVRVHDIGSEPLNGPGEYAAGRDAVEVREMERRTAEASLFDVLVEVVAKR